MQEEECVLCLPPSHVGCWLSRPGHQCGLCLEGDTRVPFGQVVLSLLKLCRPSEARSKEVQRRFSRRCDGGQVAPQVEAQGSGL